MSGEDRRRHKRRRVDAAARLRVGERVLEARVRDICRDAVLVEADSWFPLGTDVRLTLELPGPHPPIQASGRVLRLTPCEQGTHGMAVLFSEISTADTLRIDFIVELNDEQAPPDSEA
jgi:Tfp pilus assembly protein PilZ